MHLLVPLGDTTGPTIYTVDDGKQKAEEEMINPIMAFEEAGQQSVGPSMGAISISESGGSAVMSAVGPQHAGEMQLRTNAERMRASLCTAATTRAATARAAATQSPPMLLLPPQWRRAQDERLHLLPRGEALEPSAREATDQRLARRPGIKHAGLPPAARHVQLAQHHGSSRTATSSLPAR
eukprot:COSAG06_NODE_136_length_22390_cov_14.138711_2_plen_181_part_00